MERDMDLVREMLLTVEAGEHGIASPIAIEGYTQEQIGYHAILLGEAGLAEVINMTGMGSPSPEGSIHRLTWAGHEFLDASRDNTVWNQAKDAVGKVGGATFQIWLTVLSGYLQQKLGISQ